MKNLSQEFTERTEKRRNLPPFPLLPPVKNLFRLLCLLAAILSSSPVAAQIQPAWVARYNNGIPAGNHQALKIALDTNGNIYICGFSQNANSNLDYAILKYAPNGNLLWAARLDSTNVSQARPAGFALDPGGNALVTGNAGTAKVDVAGNQLWFAPYAGLAVAADLNSNVIVTGFGTNFESVKLSSTGTNLWLATYKDVGPTVGQALAIDRNGDVCVAGSDVYAYYFNHVSWSYYAQLLTVKFDSFGNQLWKAAGPPASQFTGVQAQMIAINALDDIYLMANFQNGPGASFFTCKYSSNGALGWSVWPDSGTGPGNGLALDANTNVLLIGQDAYQYNGAYSYYYSAFKLSPNGSVAWSRHYPQPPVGSGAAASIAIDSASICYVTGYSPGTITSNDIVTIAYDSDGRQLWLQRYDGPAHGDDAGNAIATDNHGNVYVAGYETVPGGGTEMVLIKYAPRHDPKTSANMLLQAQGSSGEPFDIQASTNLQTWLDLGTNHADTNGLLQYLDTNASLYPWRFYLAIPQ